MLKKTLLFTLLIIGHIVIAQPDSKTRILFILDGSQSMLGVWESATKMQVAQRMLTHLADSISNIPNVEMALRVFGHQSPVPPQDCNDTKLEIPFAPNNAQKIIQKLKNIEPKGTTPIAYSLGQSINDFPKCENCRNIIILITDGVESCEGDACKVSIELQKNGIVLKPFIIGIGLDDDSKNMFDCVGRFYNATGEQRFREILEIIITQTLNNTTAQVNLLDIDYRPTETDVNMTFYNSVTGKMYANYIHTFNYRGLPDTLTFDPLPVYKMVVHTIPPVVKDSIVLSSGKHNIIAVDAPQGYITVKTGRAVEYKNLQFIVRVQGHPQTINVQTANTTQKYLVGKYQVELLTIPKLVLDSVDVGQSHTTTIDVPDPGLITFSAQSVFFGALYKETDKGLQWVMNLNGNTTIQTYSILPGSYKVITRARNVKESQYTNTKSFTVLSGDSFKVNVF